MQIFCCHFNFCVAGEISYGFHRDACCLQLRHVGMPTAVRRQATDTAESLHPTAVHDAVFGGLHEMPVRGADKKWIFKREEFLNDRL